MEHFKSTIATTAIAAFGLVAAAHILHPGNFERTTYPSRPVATVAAQPAPQAWVNPPAALAVSAPAPVVQAEAPQPVPSPVAWTSAHAEAPAPIRTAEAAPEHRRKAGAHRRKLSQRPAQVRQAALTQPAQPAAAAPAPKRDENRIDPIGDIIRGLGLGSDS